MQHASFNIHLISLQSTKVKKETHQLLLGDYSYLILKKHVWLSNLTQTPATMEHCIEMGW
jgi:hypothetical protein